VNVRRLAIDALIAVALFGAAAWWGTSYWNASFKAGRAPMFYQEYFEPAVMMACGKGFVIAHPQVPEMAAFLLRRTDRFSCSDIPADAKLGTEGMYQGVWRYLMIATATGWRLLGISWSGMGPLFGVLFAATIVLGYGILRLGMGRVLALACACALTVSTLHLLNLPHLRDYAKAPFTLALILIMGLVVKRRPTRRLLLGCAAAYGVVLGIGYGFRTDFLVNIPVFFVALFVFVDGGLLKNLHLKAAAAALCLAVFLATAWPVISVVYRSGGCQWHTALLGLTAGFAESLGIQPAPYDWGEPYADGFIDKTVTSYGRRIHPGVGHIEYCSHEYDKVTGQYLIEIAGRFPADMLTRAYASSVQITKLPFPWFDAPLPDFASPLYSLRMAALKLLKGSGIVWVALAILLVATTSVRLALFLAFFFLYFAGYPAIQFFNRHHFHLEIITWWAIGFVLQQLAAAVMAWWRPARQAGVVVVPNWMQAGRVALVIVVVCLVPLGVLRIYQQLTLRRFFDRYVAAPVEQLPIDPAPPGVTHVLALAPAADEPTGEVFLVATLNAWQCGEKPSVTFRYDKAFPADDFSRTFTLERRSPLPEPTRIFVPVYRHFVGVEFSDVHPGCIGGVARIRDVKSFTLMLPAVLPPRWDRDALYQQFKPFGATGMMATAFLAVTDPDEMARGPRIDGDLR
jgi:hypothetical protein